MLNEENVRNVTRKREYINANQMFFIFVSGCLWVLSLTVSSWLRTETASAGLWSVIPMQCDNRTTWDHYCAELKPNYTIWYANSSSPTVFTKEQSELICRDFYFIGMRLMILFAGLFSITSFFLGSYIILNKTIVNIIILALPFALSLISAFFGVGALIYWESVMMIFPTSSCYSMNIAAFSFAFVAALSMIITLFFPGLFSPSDEHLSTKQNIFAKKKRRNSDLDDSERNVDEENWPYENWK